MATVAVGEGDAAAGSPASAAIVATRPWESRDEVGEGDVSAGPPASAATGATRSWETSGHRKSARLACLEGVDATARASWRKLLLREGTATTATRGGRAQQGSGDSNGSGAARRMVNRQSKSKISKIKCLGRECGILLSDDEAGRFKEFAEAFP